MPAFASRLTPAGGRGLNSRMEIANPIYDAAFKYLMQDDRAARLLVGRIAGLDIESLELRPQELATPRQADYERREKERESRRADRAERALSQALSRSIRQLHRLAQEPDAIARTLSMDVGEVRRVLAASEDRKGSA